ncbi:MAG: hypothetical protein U0354_08020 [Candidatus Sericytochromatia bacterium]
MNVLDEVLEEVIKVATVNKKIILEIKSKSKSLMIEDLFNITKIFVSRNGKNVASGFTLEEFKKADPEGYFNKIIKGFCKSLIDLSQSSLNEKEEEEILQILEKVKE